MTLSQVIYYCMARCIIDAMAADFAKPEFRAGYEKWLKERSDSK